MRLIVFVFLGFSSALIVNAYAAPSRAQVWKSPSPSTGGVEEVIASKFEPKYSDPTNLRRMPSGKEESDDSEIQFDKYAMNNLVRLAGDMVRAMQTSLDDDSEAHKIQLAKDLVSQIKETADPNNIFVGLLESLTNEVSSRFFGVPVRTSQESDSTFSHGTARGFAQMKPIPYYTGIVTVEAFKNLLEKAKAVNFPLVLSKFPPSNEAQIKDKTIEPTDY